MSAINLIYAVDKDSYNRADHIGVRNKINMQLSVMTGNGINASICEYTWVNGLPTISVNRDTHVLYFRTIGPSVKLAMMLRGLKKTNPGLKILMEIPTYPFDGESSTKKSMKARINEYLGTLLWRTCLDRIVIISLDYDGDYLFGVKTIHMNNGIAFDSFTPVECKKTNSIDMIAVSGCYFWHGYELLIEGLHRYYMDNGTSREINLHIVGEGECLPQYREVSEKYRLTNSHVFFYGSRTGEALEQIYKQCNIAADCFGAFRKGIYKACSLKSREYAAHGLPIVSSVGLDLENEDTSRYICILECGEIPVDFNRVVAFFDSIYNVEDDGVEINSSIRDTFRPYCDINMTYNNVIEYIVNGKG